MSVPETMHATCVAWDDRAVLITGSSGAGKSALGLSLLAYGCQLVADDYVRLTRQDCAVMAHSPDTIAGLIEARGLGILQAQARSQATIVLVVDLDQPEEERLPPKRRLTLLGRDLPLIYRVDAPVFAPGILQILKLGWSER
jgi:HPr kinase/phosphorylase